MNLLEKRNFELAHQSHLILIHKKTREVALNCRSFEQKFVSTMVFQTKYSPGLTLPDHTTPVESDSKSFTLTIPTKIQLKRSKNDPVRPVNNNDGYHVISSSNNTQPKISSNNPAPPHPSQYPHVVIPKDPPGLYNQEGTAPPALKFPVKITVYQLQQYATAPDDVGDVEPISNDTFDLAPTTPPVLASTLEWTKVMRERPMVESIPKYTRYSTNDEYVHDDDDDELIPIPCDMFEMDPTIPPKEQPIPSVIRTVKNKVQPTKPIPTRVSNKYAIVTWETSSSNISKSGWFLFLLINDPKSNAVCSSFMVSELERFVTSQTTK